MGSGLDAFSAFDRCEAVWVNLEVVPVVTT
jgi:hypothetical protein